ncbi:hypothetical protein AB1484_27690 [Parafrankia sp. FMc6]|uniref:hypothetical protein n=1 Tax=Parafrankia soli TaxID=2599596 RepID=UPI0034D48BA3
MTTTIIEADLTPVQRAAVAEISGLYEPECRLNYEFSLPNGGMRLFYAWTPGGEPLGDQADDMAISRGLGLADQMAITNPHATDHSHGAVKVHVYRLRPILAAIRDGVRDDGTYTEAFRRLLHNAATHTSWTPDPARTARALSWQPYPLGPARMARR